MRNNNKKKRRLIKINPEGVEETGKTQKTFKIWSTNHGKHVFLVFIIIYCFSLWGRPSTTPTEKNPKTNQEKTQKSDEQILETTTKI